MTSIHAWCRLIAGMAAGVPAPPGVVAQSNPEPIRIGFLTVRTGALAADGKQMEEGINRFLKEPDSTLAGRKVELIVADTGGTPAQARTKTQELVEKNNVHVIIGPLATFEALAIDDYNKQVQVPLITPTSAAQKDLAQQKLSDYVIHAVGTAAQPMHVLGDFAARKLGMKRVPATADDVTYGHDEGILRTMGDEALGVYSASWYSAELDTPENKRFVDAVQKVVGDYGSCMARSTPTSTAAGFQAVLPYAEFGVKKTVLGCTKPGST